MYRGVCGTDSPIRPTAKPQFGHFWPRGSVLEEGHAQRNQNPSQRREATDDDDKAIKPMFGFNSQRGDLAFANTPFACPAPGSNSSFLQEPSGASFSWAVPRPAGRLERTVEVVMHLI